MEDEGCLGAFFLGADILLVTGDLIHILSGEAKAIDYVGLVILAVIGVYMIVQYLQNR